MILKSLLTAAKVAVTAHKLLSAVSAIFFISHGLYQFFTFEKPRARKNK